jgi:hypothetical protein
VHWFVAGFVTDDDVRKKEEGLRRAILRDGQVRVKANAQPEVAQVGGMHTFVPHFCTNRFVFIC